MNRICEYCGSAFVPKRANALYCCKRCKDNASKVRRGIKPVTVKKRICESCGIEFETVYNSKRYCSERCHNRKYNARSWDEYCADMKKASEERKAAKKEAQKERIKTYTTERTCVECGKKFKCVDYKSTKTCGKECSRKHRNRRTAKDKRIPKSQIIDKDITLQRLYRRDGGKCWICGNTCDWLSKRVSKNGFEYPGDKYPTIDHTVPVSRGGLHSWENVRLACWKCNLAKSDKVYTYDPISKSFAYSERKKRGTQAKRTIQRTASGEVVRVWESTGEIERTLGLNSKRIQNVCRGEGKTAFGYVWEYESKV